MHSTIRPVRSATMSRTFAALICIIVLGFAIRLVGVDWDDGRYMHPDERHIVIDVVAGRIDFSWPPSLTWLDPEQSPINPRPRRDDGSVRGFAYGTLPVYTVDIAGKIGEHITGEDWDGVSRVQYIGRGISVLLDTATILIVFLIGAALAGRVAGLLAGTVYAFLPIAIQLSHFFTVDTWLTFFLTAGIYTCIRATDNPSLRNFGLAGVWFGLAMASKSSALPFIGIILLTLVLASFKDADRGYGTTGALQQFAVRGSATLIAFMSTFFIGEPFAFVEPRIYLDAFRMQANIQSGVIDAPFTQQYVNTIPFSYQFGQSIRFGLGPVAILLGMAGAILLAWLAIRRHSAAAMVLIAWMIGYLAVILFPETKFLRYLLPMAPALAVTAGMAIAALVVALAARQRLLVALGVAVTMTLLSTGYGAAFSSVTSREHSRIGASVWMYENLPPGSTTSSEIWDDRLPLTVGVGWSTDMRRIDDASINHFQYRPTLGDLIRLAPSLTYLPDGDTLSATLRSGDVQKVADGLRGLSSLDLESIDPVSVARFQSSLITSSAAMTTSNELSRTVSALSRVIALDGALQPSHLTVLATALERASDASVLSATYDLLSETDYYVLASNRVQSAIDQNPWRYAVPDRLYELLDEGSLGFDRVAQFSSSPTLFGMTFPDQDGDEAYLNYDHPAVTVYEKSELVPFDEFMLLNGFAAFMQTQPTRSPDTEPLTFEEPVSERPAVGDARWSESITGSSWGAAIAWVLMLMALQFAALPIARTVFRNFPDRGWGYSRLIGALLPATVNWWLSSVGLMQFRAQWVVLSLALFALAAWLWLPTNLRSDIHRQSRRRLLLSAEMVFWLTFGLFLLFRMINPDSWHPIWGGEKPMEFAQINAILRSATFPPVDPWYAGGFINYYYYGFYLTAWLIKLTGIPIEYAFNLAQPTFIAFLASTAFSTGSAIGSKLSRGKSNPIWSGILAVLLVSFAGNMRAVGQLVASLQDDSVVGNRFDYWVFQPSRAIEYAITEFPYFTGLYADLHPHVVALPITVLCIGIAATLAFDGISRSTLMSRSSLARIVVAGFAIGTLYPTNAWDLPVYSALIGVSVVSGTTATRGARSRLAAILATIGTIGVIAFIILLPFLMHYEALFGSIDTVRSQTSVLDLESHLGGPILILTVSMPVLMAFVARGRQMLPPVETFLLLTSVLLIRWACVDLRPSLVPYLDDLTVVIVAAIWLTGLFTIARETRRLDFSLPHWTLMAITGIGTIATIGAVVTDREVMGLYLAMASSATGVWLLAHNSGLRFLAAMIAAASFVGAGLEIVFLVDDLASQPFYRMNTVFKFYNQIWILFGIAGGAAIGALAPLALSRYRHRFSSRGNARWSQSRQQEWGSVAIVVLAVVILLSSVYPITATAIRLETRFPNREGGFTLNAYAWMDYGAVQMSDGTVVSFDEDRDVIDWFNQEVEGTPVIAEASFGPYRCNGSRISIGTGLPSVLGWQRHEMQQRNPAVLPQREEDLRTLYGTTDVDTKLEILNRYDVQYIVVGQLERNYPVVDGNNCVPMDQTSRYDHFNLDQGIAVFEDMEGISLELAFQSGSTKVYRYVGN